MTLTVVTTTSPPQAASHYLCSNLIIAHRLLQLSLVKVYLQTGEAEICREFADYVYLMFFFAVWQMQQAMTDNASVLKDGDWLIAWHHVCQTVELPQYTLTQTWTGLQQNNADLTNLVNAQNHKITQQLAAIQNLQAVCQEWFFWGDQQCWSPLCKDNLSRRDSNGRQSYKSKRETTRKRSEIHANNS